MKPDESVRAVTEAIADKAEHKCLECGSKQVGSSYDATPIEKALDAARREGFAQAIAMAAWVCDYEANIEPFDRLSACHRVDAEAVRALQYPEPA